MFIQTETTPNPQTLKFLLGRTVMARGTADFRRGDDVSASPFAARLLEMDGIAGLLLGSDFISVSLESAFSWDDMKASVLNAIMAHFVAGLPVITEGEAVASSGGATFPLNEDDPIVVQIRDLLETRVRPSVARDGGDIMLKGYDEGIVYLVMQGACAGCPSATMTLKHGIENMLRYYIPDILEVRAVE